MGVHTLWFMPLTPISEKNKKGFAGQLFTPALIMKPINPEFW
jgi:hypothetical protein